MKTKAKLRWTSGSPRMSGYYDCRLEDAREVVVHYFPESDSEIHPYGELLECAVVAYRRIPGQRYQHYPKPPRRKA